MSAKMLLSSFAVLFLATTVLAGCTKEFDKECCEKDVEAFSQIAPELAKCEAMKEGSTDKNNCTVQVGTAMIINMKCMNDAFNNGCLGKVKTEDEECCEAFEPLIKNCAQKLAEKYKGGDEE